jgi:zinc D-Ala-D-Ala carboxypeptidase|tara:strand:- start:176 stop:556 length:381 start_codon:yes stop_codon:yes gene_type:complete
MNWKYFTKDELACQGTGECEMNEEFMEKLITLREEYNNPIIITSGYRHLAHNQSIGGAKNSPHLFGRAVDIKIGGQNAVKILELALKHGMTGIGIKQRGKYEARFIHIDDMPQSEDHPRPWIWSYK